MATEEFNSWLKDAVERNYEELRGSSIYLGLCPDSMKKDPLPALQLGLAMLMDKPIVILAKDGEAIPENIRKVAREIVRFDLGDPDSAKDRLAEVLKRIMITDWQPPAAPSS
jgi:hypothetical protein